MRVQTLLFAVGLVATTTLHAEADATPEHSRVIVLRAIRQVEGVKNPARRGPAGELGYYRITASVWAQHTRQPFSLCATNHGLEQAVAEKHLLWLTLQLRRRAIRPTPYRLGYAWNAGLEAACFQIPTDLTAADYAQRVENLCTPSP